MRKKCFLYTRVSLESPIFLFKYKIFDQIDGNNHSVQYSVCLALCSFQLTLQNLKNKHVHMVWTNAVAKRVWVWLSPDKTILGKKEKKNMANLSDTFPILFISLNLKVLILDSFFFFTLCHYFIYSKKAQLSKTEMQMV